MGAGETENAVNRQTKGWLDRLPDGGQCGNGFPDLQRVTTTKMEMQERSGEVQPAMALGCGSPSSGGRRRRLQRR